VKLLDQGEPQSARARLLNIEGRENRPSGGHYCKRICNRGRRYGWLRLKGLFYQQHSVLLRLPVLVPVFAVLGSHQQGKRSSP